MTKQDAIVKIIELEQWLNSTNHVKISNARKIKYGWICDTTIDGQLFENEIYENQDLMA